MTRLHLILFLFLFCISSFNTSSAAVISRDWMTPGDGLLTYDTVNKREWLDLSQTLLSDQFPGSGSDPAEVRESRYQYVASQVEPGGLFDGFRLARSIQVLDLAQSAGIDTSTFSYSINSAATSVLGNLLGFTISAPNGNKLASGMIDELDGALPFNRLIADFHLGDGFQNQAGLQLSSHFQSSIPSGVMLYRIIPEPSAVYLIVSILICSQRILRRVYECNPSARTPPATQNG